MATTHRAIRRLVLAGLVLGAVHVRLWAEPEPPEVVRGAGTYVTIDATDASVVELVRMLARATNAKIVLAADPAARLTVKLRGTTLKQALDTICALAGLQWTTRDGIIIVDQGKVRVEVSPGPAKLEGNWRTWGGQLSEEMAALEFVPVRMRSAEGEGRLRGTLGDVVGDLKAAGVDISVDPSATVGLVETALELPWHGGPNTVETVLLRLALAAGSGSPRIALLQWVDEEGHTTDRLRVVPSTRWPGALNEYVQALDQATYMRPFVTYGPMGERNVQWYSSGCDPFMATEPPPAALQAKIDLDLTEVPLSDALKAIEAKLGKPVNLAEGVKADTKVSVHAKEAPIIRVLTDILRPLNLSITYAGGDEFNGVTVVPSIPMLQSIPFLNLLFHDGRDG
jgi:hypothetical protein